MHVTNDESIRDLPSVFIYIYKKNASKVEIKIALLTFRSVAETYCGAGDKDLTSALRVSQAALQIITPPSFPSL